MGGGRGGRAILCAFLSTDVCARATERKGPREARVRGLHARAARVKRGKEGRGRTSASREFDAGRSSNPMIAS